MCSVSRQLQLLMWSFLNYCTVCHQTCHPSAQGHTHRETQTTHTQRNVLFKTIENLSVLKGERWASSWQQHLAIVLPVLGEALWAVQSFSGPGRAQGAGAPRGDQVGETTGTSSVPPAAWTALRCAWATQPPTCPQSQPQGARQLQKRAASLPF